MPLASISQTRTRLPVAGCEHGPATAAIVVLPTPPLPVTKSSRRSSNDRDAFINEVSRRSRCGDHRRACRPRRRRSSPPGRRPACPSCRDPQHVGLARERRLDLRGDLVALVVGHFDAQFPRGLGHSDANVHVSISCAVLVLCLRASTTLRGCGRGRRGAAAVPLVGRPWSTDQRAFAHPVAAIATQRANGR